MSFEQSVFYLFSGLAIAGATNVILARNPVKAVLSLVLTFFATAVIWMLLKAEFLSVILVLVYVGAIMVLFLFVVMMLDVELASVRSRLSHYWLLGTVVAGTFVSGLIYVVGPQQFGIALVKAPNGHSVDYSNIKALGTLLYSSFLYPLELAGVLLLVAMVAAISLTFRGKRLNKVIDPKHQVFVSKEDRLRIVNMPSEKRE